MIQPSLFSDFSAQAVGDVYRATITGIGEAGVHLNNIHLRQEGSLAVSAEEHIQAGLTSTLSAYRALFPPNFTITDFGIARVSVGQTGLPVTHYPLSLAGTRGDAERLPHQCACVVTIKGTGGNRRQTGRVFLGYLLENDQQNGLLIPAYINLANAWVAAVATVFDGSANPFRFGVFSRAGNQFSNYVSHTVRTTVYSQRRRRRGHGV